MHLVADEYQNIVPLEEGFNVITGVELNHILNISELKDTKGEHTFNVHVGVTVRSTYTNEVVSWECSNPEQTKIEKSILNVRWVEEDDRDLQGYFLLMSNVQALLNEHFNMDSKMLMKSVLQPIGLIKHEDDLIILFHLILQDNFLDTLTPSNPSTKLVFEKIEDLNNFTNLSYYTRIVLPTLKIVKGSESVENQSSRE